MENKHTLSDMPWGAIVAVLAATGGFFLYLNPLETSRPTERAGYHIDLDRPQDVDARLWQDPLRTTTEHEVREQWEHKDELPALNEENAHHEVETLDKQLQSKKCWVLAVMIPGGSYAEYAEIRLRMRQAVLEALGWKDYKPADGEHIGYVKFSELDKPEWGWRNIIVPYEWCVKKQDQVCVIWLRDEEFQKEPLRQLDEFFRHDLRVDTTQIDTRIIGPRNSTTLQAMICEIAKFDSPQNLLENAQMWCATATASDELLLQGTKGADDCKTIEDLFRKKFVAAPSHQPFKFQRSTLTDKDVISALLHELQQKHQLHFSSNVNGDRNGHDHVVLLSEWDTFYGRALPRTFQREIPGAIREDPTSNVLVLHYLRGIDGMIPGAVTSNEEKSKPAEQKKAALARETTEGLSQVDYLRRLAKELADRDEEFRRRGDHGIKAVGVLGSDVYDTLLVLEALRRSLPDAIFFTNNFDARLAHPDEWRWTRNLIVGSPFGLSLSYHHQKVPPFRDSNQTAIYTATLLAAGGAEAANFTKKTLRPVRLYEIGRKGAFDLTKAPASKLQPESLDIKLWWNWRRLSLAVAILLLVMGAVVWTLRMIVEQSTSVVARHWYRRERSSQHRPRRMGFLKRGWAWLRWNLFRSNRSTSRMFGSSWTMFILLAFFSIVAVWVISLFHRLGGEPYSWTDGISVWPTETLRLLAFLLAAFYIWKTSRMLHRSRRELELDFGLVDRHRDPSARSRRLSKSWWCQLLSHTTVRHWKCEENHQVNAEKLWRFYVESGEERIRWLRILPLIVLYLAAGICLMHLLGPPLVPARGEWAQHWDIIFDRLSMFACIVLTFYVADATLLNRRLIHYLTKGITKWPKAAFKNLRWRWRLNQTENSDVPPTELLVDYLDIDLLARRTQVVGALIYYPFVIISLLIISRFGLFDYWTWPLPLLILLGLTGGYATFSAVHLRRTAERARQNALQRLNDRLIAYTAAGRQEDKDVKTIRETVALIRAENRGAFAAISQHPLATAIALPSGSAGIWALLEYFPRLFS